MSANHLVIFNDVSSAGASGISPSWKIVAGDPQVTTWRKLEDGDGTRISGIWQSTPGTFEVDYSVWEFCHFLEGECILTEKGQEPRTLKAGDAFVVQPGFKGRWEVVKTVRKHFVIVL